MAKNKKRPSGVRIGSVTIKPAGLILLAVILIAIIVAIVFGVKGARDNAAPVATPTPEPTASPIPTDTPIPTPVPTATPRPEPRSATIRALPEIYIDDAVRLSAKSGESSFSFHYIFENVRSLMSDADYTIAQVEGTLGDTVAYNGTEDKMNVPSSILTALADCGVDLVNMGNDHAFDGGLDEIYAGCRNVASNNMLYIGAGTTDDDSDIPTVANVNGINVGFLSYTESLSAKTTKKEKTKLKRALDLVDQSDCAADIRNARIAGADYIIVCVNWGKMYTDTPTADQKKIAQTIANAGADMIIGYNAHTVQPMTYIQGESTDGTIRKVICVNGLGTFLSDVKDESFANCGVVLDFTLQEQDDGSFVAEDIRYIPTVALCTDNSVTETSMEEPLSVEEILAAVTTEEVIGDGDEEEITEEEPAEEEYEIMDGAEIEVLGENGEVIAVEEYEEEEAEEEPAEEEDTEVEDTEEDIEEETEVEEEETEVVVEEAAEEYDVTSGYPNPSATNIYRILTVGDWLKDDSVFNPLEGMSTDQVLEMGKIWAYVQRVIGTEVATVAKG